jgi:hypothetical protein
MFRRRWELKMAFDRRALDRQRETELERVPIIVKPGDRLQGILNAVVPQPDGTGYIRELNRLWEQVRDKFLAIGEYLELAKVTLPHGHYEAMFADTKRVRPPAYGEACLHFNSATGTKLRAIYRATRDGRIPRENLPQSWSTAYEITKLSDNEFRAALTRGLVRRDVYLSEILSLVRELRAPSGSSRQVALTQERESVLKEMRRLRKRLAEIEEEIGSVGDNGVLSRDHTEAGAN